MATAPPTSTSPPQEQITRVLPVPLPNAPETTQQPEIVPQPELIPEPKAPPANPVATVQEPINQHPMRTRGKDGIHKPKLDMFF